MKLKDIEQLKKSSPSDLEKLLGEEREKLRVLRFDLAAGKVKNTDEIGEARKKIARILTFLKIVKQ